MDFSGYVYQISNRTKSHQIWWNDKWNRLKYDEMISVKLQSAVAPQMI